VGEGDSDGEGEGVVGEGLGDVGGGVVGCGDGECGGGGGAVVPLGLGDGLGEGVGDGLGVGDGDGPFSGGPIRETTGLGGISVLAPTTEGAGLGSAPAVVSGDAA
jgi:hypothetical protein